VAAYNLRLRLHNLARTDFFGSVDDLLRRTGRLHGRVEAMVHPVLDADGRIVEAESGKSLRDHLGPLLAYVERLTPTV
jgi:hypothetical protein